MLLKEFKEKVISSYNKQFPFSKCTIQVYKGLSEISLYMHCFLAGEKTENNNNYWENDMLNVRFRINVQGGNLPENVNDNTDIDFNFVLTNLAKSYLITPQQKYLAYSSKSLKFRKITGDTNKIIKALDKFFIQLKDSVVDDKNNNLIANSFINIANKKII